MLWVVSIFNLIYFVDVYPIVHKIFHTFSYEVYNSDERI
jgi:hypothetical protein